MAQTNDTPGFVYLLHFHGNLGTGAHYIGFAEDVDNRVKQHAKGTASRFTGKMKKNGIGFVLARIWPGPKKLEREIKKLRRGPKLCPICQAVAYKRAEGSDAMLLLPAMGREYNTVDEVKRDWEGGKSFVVGGPGNGYYITKPEVETTTTESKVEIIYHNRTRILHLDIERSDDSTSDVDGTAEFS